MFLRRLMTAASLGPRARWCITNKAADDDPEGSAGSGLSDDADADEELKLDEDEQEQEAGKAKGAEEQEEELSEEDRPYKKRYADTKADRDRLKQEADDLRAENAALKRQTQRAQRDQIKEPEEARLAEEATAAAEKEFFELPKLEQTNGRFTRILTKHTLRIVKDTATKASQQTYQSVKTEEHELAEAERDARTALKDIGLEHDIYYDLLVHEAKKQATKDPTWFDKTTVPEQYPELAKRVKETVSIILKQKQETDEAKDEHRREAGGIMPAGSRSASKVKAGEKEEKEGEDTLISAINRDRKALQRRGQQFAALASQPRP